MAEDENTEVAENKNQKKSRKSGKTKGDPVAEVSTE
jgi:hypothetical protein